MSNILPMYPVSIPMTPYVIILPVVKRIYDLRPSPVPFEVPIIYVEIKGAHPARQ